MCFIRIRNASSILLSHRRSIPCVQAGLCLVDFMRNKNHPEIKTNKYLCFSNRVGLQLRRFTSTTTDNVNYNDATSLKNKKVVAPFPIEQDGYSSQLPPPTNTPNSQAIWLAALAFILGINVGGAYVVYNSKIKRTVDDPKRSGRSKRKQRFILFFFTLFSV